MSTHDDDVWLAEAVALATANVHEGGGPFGAVVVRRIAGAEAPMDAWLTNEDRVEY